jgi:ribonucleoside-diphosphate reductase alpha chain
MSYEEFVKVYELAYSLGCKGCTTYRPSDIRGAVLSAPNTTTSDNAPSSLPVRPPVLQGYTYKLKWPSIDSAVYLTVNEDADGKPFELFIASKDARHLDWSTTVTTLISAIWRTGGDARFIASELMQIQSLNDGAFQEGRHHPSFVAYIGFKLDQHINGKIQEAAQIQATPKTGSSSHAATCPKCRNQSLIKEEGCSHCTICSYSSC